MEVSSPHAEPDRIHCGASRKTTMPQTLSQRLTLVLPLLGVAFLLPSMVLPMHFAVIAWGLAMISFLAALACAIVARRATRIEGRRASYQHLAS